MGTYNPGKIPEGKFIDPSWLYKELLKLKQAINFLSEENFPSKLLAEDVLQGGITLGMISGIGEWRIPILGLATPYTTSSTSLVNVGPYVYFDVNRWAGILTDQVLLEVTAGPSAASGQTEIQLDGVDGTLAKITLPTVGLNWVAQPFQSLPKQSGTLVLKIRTTNSNSLAQITGANILIRP